MKARQPPSMLRMCKRLTGITMNLQRDNTAVNDGMDSPDELGAADDHDDDDDDPDDLDDADVGSC